ncbi:MAG: HAMP domain-containing histidine kinase [Actinomycetota bacterium]|nr:HAMP domain-containing histidine kinase [Actinomycetota bacterium]
MSRRLLPRGLRAQLALAIALVAALTVGASFLALYSGTGSRLQSQIDTQLRTQAAAWRQFTVHATFSTPAALERTATQFIAAQRYHAESLIIVIQVNAGRTVSNNSELLVREEAREQSPSETTGLLDSPTGLATGQVAEAGTERVLTQPIDYRKRRVGMLRLASPLTPVQRAQASLRRTFLVVGGVALALAIAAGIGLATFIAAPLRRIARVAAAVDAGDLSLRAGPVAAGGELGVLSDAFDRMLERLERAFTRQRDFVSDASHELRTPLAVLRAQVELLDRETDERSRHEGAAMLLRRLDELNRLVGDMLTLASADAGQLIEPRPIDLREFFEDLRRDLPLFGERDFQLQAVDGTLQADPDRLTQVFRNIVRNAVSHTNPGDQVTITARARDGRLEISVSDSGPGIPPDQLEQIFERFHRLDHRRSRDRGGSGLGLAIARAITEAHGGSIHAESGPGQGATFRMELPGYRA